MVDYPGENLYLLVIVVVVAKIAPEFTQQPAGYRAQTPVRLLRLLPVLGVVAETLVAIDALECSAITLAKREILGRHNLHYLTDDLLEQLRVGRVCDVLLLDRGVDKRRLVGGAVIMVIVYSDALRQYQLDTLLAYALAEMHQFG